MAERKGTGTHFAGPVGWEVGAYESLTAAKTLDAKLSNGMTYGLNLAGGFTVTLPSVANAGAGWRCRFRVETNPTTAYIITEDTSVDTDVLTGGVHERDHTAAAASPYSAAFTQVNFVASVAVAGDEIEIRCNGTRYYVHGLVNADGAVTLT